MPKVSFLQTKHFIFKNESSHIMLAQHCGGCSLYWRLKVVQYIREIASVLWGDSFSTAGDSFSIMEGSFSTVEVAQYSGKTASALWGYLQYCGGNISTCEDNISTVEGIQYCGGIPSVLWEMPSVLWRLFSKVGNNIESWTGVLQVRFCFEIIDNYILGMLYLSFKFNCLCDCT